MSPAVGKYLETLQQLRDLHGLGRVNAVHTEALRDLAAKLWDSLTDDDRREACAELAERGRQ